MESNDQSRHAVQQGPQVGHSGQEHLGHAREQPTTEFGMPLSEAVDQHLVDENGNLRVPAHAGALTDEQVASERFRDKLSTKVGVGVTALAVVAGVIFGIKNSDASAAGPDVQPSATSSSSPSASEVIPTTTFDKNTGITLETYPFVANDGSVLNGLAEYRKTNQLETSNYQDITAGIGPKNDSGERLMADFIARLNSFIRSGDEKPGMTREEMQSLAQKYYDPAFLETMSDNQDFDTFITSLHESYLSTVYLLSNSYSASLKENETSTFSQAGLRDQNGVGLFLDLTFVDDAGLVKSTDLQMTVVLEQVQNTDGTSVFKVKDFGSNVNPADMVTQQ